MSEANSFADLLYKTADSEFRRDTTLILGGVKTFIIQNIKSAHYVLRHNSKNYIKSMDWFRQTFGASRFTENDESWRIRQELSQTYLSRFDRDRAYQTSVLFGKSALDILVKNSNQGDKNISDSVLRDLAASIMLDVFFQRDLVKTGVALDDIAAMLQFGSEYSFVATKAQFPRNADETRNFLKVRSRVLNALQSFRMGDATQGGLLDAMRKLDNEGSYGFRLEHEIAMFFAAASETTAATLGWAAFILARNPELQDSLRVALKKLPPLEECDWRQIEQHGLLRNFVSEVLRIFPSTPVIARRAIDHDRIGDYSVEAGEQILVSMIGIQRERRENPSFWNINLADLSAEASSTGNPISFSIGPRMCGGSRFAMLELMAILCLFIREGQFEPTSDHPPQFVFQTQLMHDNGQPVRVDYYKR